MSEPLSLLSRSVVDKLLQDVDRNVEIYRSGSFKTMWGDNGWRIETKFSKFDPSIASELDPARGPEAEIRNSLLIYRTLEGMTPALAREERLWARLCHVEFFDYACSRWLSNDLKLANQIRRHFFASNLGGCRDDNAIGRLWWNGHIAALACPDDIETGLRNLLARANIRLQIVDRADSAFRQPLISGIIRLLGVEKWFEVEDKAVAFFMLEVNKRSGGIVFEALSDREVDNHLLACLNFARLRWSQQ